MIDQIDNDVTNETVNTHTVMSNSEFTALRHHNLPHQCWQQLDTPSDVVVRDFHNQDKVRGFLPHDSMDFEFIGPDRQPSSNTSLKDYIHMANIIQATGVPNYKLARFPIQ